MKGASKPAPSALSARHEFEQSWKLVGATMVGTCCSSLLAYSFNVFVDPLKGAFGWSQASIGAYAFFVNSGYVIAAPWVGRLIDKIGARNVLLVSIPLLSLVWCGFALVGASLWSLYGLSLAAGVVSAGATIVAYSRVINGWFVAGRGTALGLMACGLGIASMLGPRAFQVIVDAKGWRTGFVVMGVAAFVAWPFVAGLLPRSGSGAPNQEYASSEKGCSRSEALRQPIFWLMAAASFCWLFAFGHVVHLVSFLTSCGYSRSRAATYAGLLGASSIFGRFGTGLAIDRINVPSVAAIVFMLQALALAALGHFQERFAFAAIAIMGFSHGAEIDCIGYLTAGYFGLRAFGEIFGFVVIATVLGSATGPFFFGYLRDTTGGFSVPYLAMSGFAGLSAFFMVLVRFKRPFARGPSWK